MQIISATELKLLFLALIKLAYFYLMLIIFSCRKFANQRGFLFLANKYDNYLGCKIILREPIFDTFTCM